MFLASRDLIQFFTESMAETIRGSSVVSLTSSSRTVASSAVVYFLGCLGGYLHCRFISFCTYSIDRPLSAEKELYVPAHINATLCIVVVSSSGLSEEMCCSRTEVWIQGFPVYHRPRVGGRGI